MRIIKWSKDLTKDEMPPQWKLHLDWELEEWFKKIEIERERKYGSSGSTDSEGGDIYEDDKYERNILYDRMKNGESLY